MAGDFGNSLKPFTDVKPKSMLEIAGRPLIEWQITWLKKFDITDIVICSGHFKEKIINHIGNGSKFGVRVGYAIEEDALGTAGAIKNAEHLLKGDFYVINGDILSSIDPVQLVGRMSTLSVVPLQSPFGIVTVDNLKRVTGFTEKPVINNIWINAGVYYFSTGVFEYLPEKGNLEDSVLPILSGSGQLRSVAFQRSYWRSINSHKDLEEAAKDIPFFLDHIEQSLNERLFPQTLSLL